MAIHYKVVFDITQKAFDWRFPAVGFLFVIVGIILAWMGRRHAWAGFQRTGYTFVGFGSLWTLTVLSTTLGEYVMLHQAYKNGQYSVVEGVVATRKCRINCNETLSPLYG
jgi:hypothetical protein